MGMVTVQTIDGEETGNTVNNNNHNLVNEVLMEDVFDERCLSIKSNIKKSADKGQGRGKTRNTLQSPHSLMRKRRLS